MLYPCVHDVDADWKGGHGPQCDVATGVEVICRCISKYYNSAVTCALRKPEPGSAFSEAALRAFNFLDLGFDGSEV